jgi:hypothetical protein
MIIAGTVAAMNADLQSDVQEGSFSVTSFSLREYKQKKPDMYRCVIILLHNTFL